MATWDSWLLNSRKRRGADNDRRNDSKTLLFDICWAQTICKMRNGAPSSQWVIETMEIWQKICNFSCEYLGYAHFRFLRCLRYPTRSSAKCKLSIIIIWHMRLMTLPFELLTSQQPHLLLHLDLFKRKNLISKCQFRTKAVVSLFISKWESIWPRRRRFTNTTGKEPKWNPESKIINYCITKRLILIGKYNKSRPYKVNRHYIYVYRIAIAIAKPLRINQ